MSMCFSNVDTFTSMIARLLTSSSPRRRYSAIIAP